jgi:hypothetical protein
MLIACALERKWPVISEDKKILMHMKREGIPYFNALMMLNFLLLEERLDLEEHSMYFRRLVQFARYSPEVLEYGKMIYTAIVNRE